MTEKEKLLNDIHILIQMGAGELRFSNPIQLTIKSTSYNIVSASIRGGAFKISSSKKSFDVPSLDIRTIRKLKTEMKNHLQVSDIKKNFIFCSLVLKLLDTIELPIIDHEGKELPLKIVDMYKKLVALVDAEYPALGFDWQIKFGDYFRNEISRRIF